MKHLIRILIVVSLTLSTAMSFAQEKAGITTKNYTLYKPVKTDGVLVLFGGFGENGAGIKTEFPITDLAVSKNVAVAYLNYNRKIFLQDAEKVELAAMLKEMLVSNDLASEALYIGGLSSGGAMALLISNYLTENSELGIKPEGVFVVDSPVDLAAMYRTAKSNVERNFSPAAAGESSFILQYFNAQLGDPDEEIAPYEKYSSFVYETENFQNIASLKDTKIRLYTEPDKTWWKENMGVDYEQMNAFHLERLSEFLVSKGYDKVEFITTEDKGYRADGSRNPHSWSIVDQDELLEWMLN